MRLSRAVRSGVVEADFVTDGENLFLPWTVSEIDRRKVFGFEAPGVEPVFRQKDQAIGYAETRACFRSGEIRILDSTGKVEHAIRFNESGRRL